MAVQLVEFSWNVADIFDEGLSRWVDNESIHTRIIKCLSFSLFISLFPDTVTLLLIKNNKNKLFPIYKPFLHCQKVVIGQNISFWMFPIASQINWTKILTKSNAVVLDSILQAGIL